MLKPKNKYIINFMAHKRRRLNALLSIVELIVRFAFNIYYVVCYIQMACYVCLCIQRHVKAVI